MEYGKIIAISGMPGLFEMVGSKQDGAIVKSLDDKTTKFVSSRVHNFSHLESIEVYTNTDNVNLVEVLKAIDTAGDALPSDKDAAAVKAFFQKVYPEMDFEKVYASDMKKMVKWYSVLKANDVEFKLSEVEDEAENETLAEEAESVTNTVIPEAEKEEVNLEPEPVAEEAAPAAEAPKKRAPRKKKTEE